MFTLIYYAAHGTDQDGNRYIYSSLDWSDPGGTGRRERPHRTDELPARQSSVRCDDPSCARRLSGIIVIIVLPFSWLLMYCLYLLRRCHRIVSAGEPKTAPIYTILPPADASASASA